MHSLGYKDVKDLCPPEIDVACHNSSSSSTISGPEEIVKTFVKQLQKDNIFARAVNVANIAYHSRYIRPAAPKLLEYLKKRTIITTASLKMIYLEAFHAHLNCLGQFRHPAFEKNLVTDPKPRSSKWISSSVPESEWETPLAKYSSAEYHTNNLLSPVLFEEATKCIPNNAIVIEIAPHGLLQAIIKKSLALKGHHIPLALRGHTNSTEFLLAAVGKLYMAGLLPKVSNLYLPVQYPVSRGTASLSSLVTWNHEDILDSPLDLDTSKMIV
uniref:Malonyl-CoA:ACP transacylase (MAT) domain-containing protein n=1 Tax=Timema douglasi TaxID=61478 RepID=A0A7R8ZEN1_TIMDO|nr:unnamed protein product [Timema douglasi]